MIPADHVARVVPQCWRNLDNSERVRRMERAASSCRADQSIVDRAIEMLVTEILDRVAPISLPVPEDADDQP